MIPRLLSLRKTANQLHGDSSSGHPTTINKGDQGAVMTDKPENLEMSIMSEVTYANHAAAINPGIKVFTNQSGEGMDGGSTSTSNQ